MSIADSVRNLEDQVKSSINCGIPSKVFTTVFPPTTRQDEWVKRKFMEAKRTARQQDDLEDAMWVVPDLPGGYW